MRERPRAGEAAEERSSDRNFNFASRDDQGHAMLRPCRQTLTDGVGDIRLRFSLGLPWLTQPGIERHSAI